MATVTYEGHTYDLGNEQGRQQLRSDAQNNVVSSGPGGSRIEALLNGTTPDQVIATRNAESGGNGGGGGGGDNQAILDAFSQSSGFKVKDLEERKRQFDAQMAWQELQWQREGLPALEIQRRLAALKENEFALQYYQTAAQMGGPSDYFQLSDFARGAATIPGMPAFLEALKTGRPVPSLAGGQGPTPPTPQTMDTLTAKVTGQQPAAAGAAGTATPAANTTDSRLLSSFGQVFGAGGGALAPQALESLTPDEMGLMSSAAKKLGYSIPSFLQQYKQSRIGQGAAMAG